MNIRDIHLPCIGGRVVLTDMGPLQTFSYSRYMNMQHSEGKIYIPVPPNQVVYSQFEHISGFAASPSQSGVSVDKIQILNTLIDQLSKLKQSEKPVKMENDLSDAQINALITDYQTKIKDSIAISENDPYKKIRLPERGGLFNLIA